MTSFSGRLDIAQNRKCDDGRRQHANGGKHRHREKAGGKGFPGEIYQRPACVPGQERGRIHGPRQRAPCRTRQFHRNFSGNRPCHFTAVNKRT